MTKQRLEKQERRGERQVAGWGWGGGGGGGGGGGEGWIYVIKYCKKEGEMELYEERIWEEKERDQIELEYFVLSWNWTDIELRIMTFALVKIKFAPFLPTYLSKNTKIKKNKSRKQN